MLAEASHEPDLSSSKAKKGHSLVKVSLRDWPHRVSPCLEWPHRVQGINDKPTLCLMLESSLDCSGPESPWSHVIGTHIKRDRHI